MAKQSKHTLIQIISKNGPSIRGNRCTRFIIFKNYLNEFTVVLDVPIKLNSNKAKEKKKEGSRKFSYGNECIPTIHRRSLASFRDYFYLLVTRT